MQTGSVRLGCVSFGRGAIKQAKAQEELSKTKEELHSVRAAEVLFGLLSVLFPGRLSGLTGVFLLG